MLRPSLQPQLFDVGDDIDAAQQASSVSGLSSEGLRPRRLWLGIYLPDLTLEVLPVETDIPLAVLTGVNQQAKVMNCNLVAANLGVKPGLSANAALALVPNLVLKPRDTRRESLALREMAECALQFTPFISLESPASLLLEIRGSLKLFGGLSNLRSSILASLGSRKHRLQWSIAPTALAALCLARGASGSQVMEQALLPGSLANLPLKLLDWPQKSLQLLAEMGVRRMGECRRLPRAGLAKRIGSNRLFSLDQAYGCALEVRTWYQGRQSFTQSIELPTLTTDLGLVVRGLEIILGRLLKDLNSCQRALGSLWLRLEHPDAVPPSLLRINLLQSGNDAAQLIELLQIKLSANPLPAPVLALHLQAGRTEPLAQITQDILGGSRGLAAELPAFIARLRARLGDEAIWGFQVSPEHRPERAWQAVSDLLNDKKIIAVNTAQTQRPLWLLPEPLSLRVGKQGPIYCGPLQLKQERERIESGWWDGKDVRRDYYQASNQQGMRLWIFRDLRACRWYLQGLFG